MGAAGILLLCALGFLGIAVLGGAIRQPTAGRYIVYGACLAISTFAFCVALTKLALDPSSASTISLPLGLPWIGAHFRLDALSAFFLVVIDLAAAAASLFAIGYGSHESAPSRILPFYPAFLAGMNLVLVADDAFSFLTSWEFMSLASWALVLAHHRVRENVTAAYVYLVMASFGTLMLLLAFGVMAGADGGYAFDQIRASHPSAAVAAL